jgi:serine O-acetyltransferase
MRLRTWRRRLGQFFGPLSFYRLGHALHRIGLTPLGEITRFLGIVIFHCDISHKAVIGARVSLPHYGLGTVIGKYATIEEESVIMPGALIGANLRTQAMPHLQRGVVVGAGAKILGGITVGEGAVIAANAVATQDVPAYHVAIGNPASISDGPISPDALDV